MQINGHTILCYLQWVGLSVRYLEQAANCTAESRDNNRNGKEWQLLDISMIAN